MTRKPTAAFRTALAAKQNKGPKPKSVLCGSVPKTIPMLPGETKAVKQNVAPPFGKPAKPLGTLARKPVAPHGRGAHIVVDPVALPSSKSREVTSPCTSYPGIPLDNGLQNLTEKPVPPVDAELVKLVSSWPRLSTSLKEIISTLIGSESAAG